MQNIISSWFVQGMIKATGDMWLKGWDERNGATSACVYYRKTSHPIGQISTLSRVRSR
ncbi:Rhamnulose-1-phosphate aldolase [Budvicia aquatica]|uniref:Rhamnulose-1-phosphate aldolase n=1 Tax=Budvicia aquatica TaxID=82979 RepID=A0A484ZBK2_9GAMM|nr:Rhamnulose-1-phosphate aldolase [Budvicia aquatica]